MATTTNQMHLQQLSEGVNTISDTQDRLFQITHSKTPVTKLDPGPRYDTM